MKTVMKIINNLINENMSLKGKLFKTRWVISEDNQFMLKHTFYIQSPSTYLFQFDLLHLLIY